MDRLTQATREFAAARGLDPGRVDAVIRDLLFDGVSLGRALTLVDRLGPAEAYRVAALLGRLRWEAAGAHSAWRWEYRAALVALIAEAARAEPPTVPARRDR